MNTICIKIIAINFGNRQGDWKKIEGNKKLQRRNKRNNGM